MDGGFDGRDKMKLKSIPLLLLLATLMVVLVACGGGISEADIEATVVARLNEEAVAAATVEAKAQAVGKAMVEATAPLVGTVAPSPPARTTIEPSGGVIAIDRAGDPLDGLTIQVPPGAYEQPRPFEISHFIGMGCYCYGVAWHSTLLLLLIT